MELDFNNQDEIIELALENLTDDSIPEWKKDIFKFIHWYFLENSDLTQHTSGSTGNPKEIFLSRRALKSSALATIEFFKTPKESTALLCIPAKFIGGKMMIQRAILGEWKLICIEPKTDISSKISLEEKIEFCAMIPAQVQVLLEKDPEKLNKITTTIIGGAPVSLELENKIISSKANCYSTYGMTETASHVALKSLDGKSKFQAMSGISFSTDKDSRLRISGKRVPSSPIQTNDIVKLDSPTSFTWLGRFDNVINSGGVKIIAEELEKTIATLIGEPFYIKKSKHEIYGEAPVLVIKGKEWTNDEQESLLIKINQKLPKHWEINSIEFTELMDKTISGKIIRS